MLYIHCEIRLIKVNIFVSILIIYPSCVRGWDDDPSTSTIERVGLGELEFPAITVCPEFASDGFAARTIFNM